MRLYVMRHGPAEDRAPSGRDFDRMLTQAGREVVERAARTLDRARGATRLRVLASPFRRARETAEVVAGHLATGEPDLREDLGADADVPHALVQELLAAGADALVVGHQPIMEELVRALIRSAQPARPPFPSGFRTASVAVLERDVEDPWRLVAVIDPHTLDR
jgi:phosphohistidine phosphatase